MSFHVVKALQGLPVWKQCFQTQFGMDFLSEEVFPKCVYVRTVDSRITVFTMYVFCCFFAMVFHLYFVVLCELVGAVTEMTVTAVASCPCIPDKVFCA